MQLKVSAGVLPRRRIDWRLQGILAEQVDLPRLVQLCCSQAARIMAAVYASLSESDWGYAANPITLAMLVQKKNLVSAFSAWREPQRLGMPSNAHRTSRIV